LEEKKTRVGETQVFLDIAPESYQSDEIDLFWSQDEGGKEALIQEEARRIAGRDDGIGRSGL